MKRILAVLLFKFGKKLIRVSEKVYSARPKEPNTEMSGENLSNQAIDYAARELDFVSVLDVGSGSGKHADFFSRKGKRVTRFDFGKSRAFTDDSSVIIGDFLTHEFKDKYDLIWASHVLEHSIYTHEFLEKLSAVAQPDKGIIAITVPPAKSEFVGGHVTLWTPALLIYRMVLAGFDCSNAKVLVYGYNISVICENKKNYIDLNQLAWDYNDIDRLSAYLPKGLEAGVDGAKFGEVYQHSKIYLS